MRSNTKVLSLNSYFLGHVTYQDVLEKTFHNHIPEIELQSHHLTDYRKGDFLGRVVNWIFTKQLSSTSLGASEIDRGFSNFRIALGSSFLARRCLARYLKIYQPDVMHLHTQAIALLSTSLMRQVPCVLSMDQTIFQVATEHFSSVHFTNKPQILLEKRCFQLAGHIITWSDWARNSVIHDYGIAPHKVTTIPNLMLLDIFKSITPRSKTSNKPKLLFVGGDFYRKGGDDLVAVFLEHFSDSCELDIVTTAEIDLPNLPNLRIHRGIRPLSPELLSLYQKADIFVMPSHEDTSPNVFVEAMAANLPCIGTTIRGIPELVQDGLNGFTVAPRDRQALRQALQKLINDPDLRLSFGCNGKKLAVQRFDAISNCKRLAQIFSHCADKNTHKS